jgi:hypothetical protein
MHYVKALCAYCTDLPDTATPEYFPEPKSFQEYLDSPYTPSQKADTVRQAWDKMPETFFSTSGLTKNGYLTTLNALGGRFVNLQRDVFRNAYSWYLMNGAPGESGRGFAYHPCIESDYNCIVVKHRAVLTSYQKCLWLVLETRARAQYIADLGGDVYNVTLEDLNLKYEVARLFDWMGVDYDISQADKILGQKINPLNDASRRLQERPELGTKVRIQQEDQLTDLLTPNKLERIRV